MDPQQYNMPSQPTVQPSTPQPMQFQPQRPKKSRLPLIVAIVAASALLLVVVSLIAFSGGSDKSATKKPTETAKSQGPQPASAIDVEQTNNSISQDITSLDDSKDLPVEELSDKSLGL